MMEAHHGWGRVSRRALHALSLAMMIGCTAGEIRQSDSAPPTLSPSVDTAAGAVSGAAASPPIVPSCVIADSSIGPIRLGMTYAEAKQAMPAAVLERTSDGEGAPLVAVMIDTIPLIILFAEDDEEGPIQWEKRISFIETFSPACSMPGGVRPESLVRDAVKVLGNVVKIELSEIESRQFITFARQPAGTTFRIDYSGIFDGDSRETQRFEPDARIFSIAISSPRIP